jgi:hypothetical protein
MYPFCKCLCSKISRHSIGLLNTLSHKSTFIFDSIGLGIGAVIASVMMSVVRGGANTLIVCFADSPARLEENHPELTLEMIDAWSTAFPDTIRKSTFVPPTAEPVTTTLYS